MSTRASRSLGRLERIQAEYGPGRAEQKAALLAEVAKARLPNAQSVQRLHESLCFLRAYPDDASLLARVEALLEKFEGRPDLRRHRKALDDSGIAGTRILFPFFPETAAWLVRHWPDRLHVDWDSFEKRDSLLDRLHLLALYSETPGLDEEPLGCREWVERMKGPLETDAAFLMRRFQALKVDEFLFQTLLEEADIPFRLEPGPGTPSRTKAQADGPVPGPFFQRGPLARGRPDLRKEIRRPPRSVKAVSIARGRRLIALAREAMVTRSRDLDVFRYGDPRDVRLLDCGDGLCFAAIGFRPERRLLLESVYGFLTLKNGVPIGYVLNSALFGSAEIAYNVFESFRGAEAGLVYGRVVASLHALFGSDSFTIYPYQLGQDNDEALESGAWWFYRKLGFAPRDRRAKKLMRSEEARIRKNPKHRSSIATLRRLADHNVYFHAGKERDDVIGEMPLSLVGLRVTDHLAARFGSDREEGEEVCAREALKRFGVRSLTGWSKSERLAWRRWGPLLMVLRGVERWSAAERRGAVQVVRAKGGRRESDFAIRFDRHKRLRREIRRLASEED